MRSYATYVDFEFIRYAAMCLDSFLATNDFDRLTILLPPDDGGRESRILADVIALYARDDARIATRDVDALPGFAESGNQSLRTGHPQLFADIVRSSVYAALGGPVVWFDADMLFLGDVSELLDGREQAPLAAASDMISIGNGRPGSNVYRAFGDYLTRAQAAVTLGDVPINCGLLVLRADLGAAFHTGLDHAVQFLGDGSAAPALTEAERSILRHTLGQLAWNYVFYGVESRQLPSRYNWFPSAHAPGEWPSDAALAPRAIHYVGSVKQWRMAVDYTILFGRGREARLRK